MPKSAQSFPPLPPCVDSTPRMSSGTVSACCPPHKVWSHDSIPYHSHDSFHPLSWRPLRFRRLAWHKWLFGLQSRVGYAHYATFWNDAPGEVDCPHCHRRHNLSLHGVLAYCAPSHPLVCAWLSSWTASNLVRTWRQAACRNDLRIVGRLAVPQSLYRYLRGHLGGLRAVRKEVGHFQNKVLDSVTAALEHAVPKRHPQHTQPLRLCRLDWPTAIVTTPLPCPRSPSKGPSIRAYTSLTTSLI